VAVMTSIAGIERNWREVAKTLGIPTYRQLVTSDPNEIDAFVNEKVGWYQLAWADDPGYPIEGPSASVAEVALFIQSRFDVLLSVTRCGPKERRRREIAARFDGTQFEDDILKREWVDGDWKETITNREDYDYRRLVGVLAPALQALHFRGTVYAYYDATEGGIVLTGWGFDNAHTSIVDLD